MIVLGGVVSSRPLRIEFTACWNQIPHVVARELAARYVLLIEGART